MVSVHFIVWPAAALVLLVVLLNFVVTTRKERYAFDRLPAPLALLKLAWMRRRLWRRNLYALYPRDDEAPEGVSLEQPERFGRSFVPRGLRPEGRSLYRPPPHEVSDALLARRRGGDAEAPGGAAGAFQPATGLNYLAAAWIHFQVHSWVAHENDYASTLDVRPSRGWKAPATRPAPPLPNDNEFGRCPVFLNRGSGNEEWGASQVYGRGDEGRRGARLYRGGLVREGGGAGGDAGAGEGGAPGPADGDASEGSWWLGADMLRWLFLREHNAVAGALAAEYPLKEDDELYETARAVITALMAKIHTLEWTPAAVDSPAARAGAAANWRGACKSCAALCCLCGCGSAAPLLGGVRGGPQLFGADGDVPAFVTEELVSAYRMHPMMRDEVPVPPLPGGGGGGGGDGGGGDAADAGEAVLAADETVGDEASAEAVRRFGMLRLFTAFGNCHPGAMSLRNYPNFMRELCVDEGGGAWMTDLAALDVMRDRERAVPRFNGFRTALGLRPVHSFDMFEVEPEVRAELVRVYEDKVDSVDTLVGLLAERRPAGHLFGNTAFALMMAMASRRMAASELLTTGYNAGSFTQLGLRWIERNSMSSVLERHLPGVAPLMRRRKRGNPFAPWRTFDAK